MPPDIEIRPVETHDEMRAVEDVQRAAWNMVERDVVPMHLMVTWVEYGGLLLGAFDGGDLVGFVLGYPGVLREGDPRAAWLGTRLQHCSEMLAVHPAYQGRGIGYRLKLAQRQALLEQGVGLATWTFDPLLSRNAHLNIRRLGGIARTYKRNVYGELHGIYAGLPTDRLEVEWWLGSRHVERRLGGDPGPSWQAWEKAGAVLLNPSTPRGDGLRAPADALCDGRPARVLVEVPADLPAVKAVDMGLARAWQEQVRGVFEALFGMGYVAAWFVTGGGGGARRSAYVLDRRLDVETLARGEA